VDADWPSIVAEVADKLRARASTRMARREEHTKYEAQGQASPPRVRAHH